MSGRWSMYRRVLVGATLLLLLLLLLGVPLPVPAQAADEAVRERPTRDRLARRLEARLEVLDARLDSFAAARPERREEPEPWRADTTRVGPFVVIAREDQSAVLAREVARALAMVESELGRVPELRPSPVLRLILDGRESTSRRPGNAGGPGDGAWTRVSADAPQLRRASLGHALAAVVAERMPPAVREWSGGRPVWLDVDRAAVRMELLGLPGGTGVECVTAGGGPCLVALGLAPGASPSGEGDQLSDRLRVRGSLLAHVLARDPDALGRLLAVEDGAGVVTALERAAAAPIADVVVEWRAGVVDAGPLPDLPRTLATTLVWLVLFAGFATRSTRWRLG